MTDFDTALSRARAVMAEHKADFDGRLAAAGYHTVQGGAWAAPSMGNAKLRVAAIRATGKPCCYQRTDGARIEAADIRAIDRIILDFYAAHGLTP